VKVGWRLSWSKEDLFEDSDFRTVAGVLKMTGYRYNLEKVKTVPSSAQAVRLLSMQFAG